MTKIVPELFLIDQKEFVNYISYMTSNSSMITADDVENIKLAYFKVYVIIPAFGLRLRINSQTAPLGWRFTFPNIGAGSPTQRRKPLQVGRTAIILLLFNCI
jgi:hypothetical protein